ncbi:MAG: SARP family transcriptional regulator [Lachnospiraceae bacterium]|nr:SARP family transcriptional regulator [Lachnospiraceae bacterium]
MEQEMTRVSEARNKEKKRSHLRISMLGTFEIVNDETKIEESLNRSKKMWNLLGYIITHRNRHISQTEYIDMLWPDEVSANPVNALKTLLSRVRNLLEPLKLNNESFIVSSQSSYHWNNQIPCKVDAEEFERLVKKASDDEYPEDVRIKHYKKALDLYKGDFLTKHSTELWVIPVSTYYHNLYIEAVKKFLALLQKQNDYETMEYYCAKALQIERFDEQLHCTYIQILVDQGNTFAALNHYEQTTNLLYSNLGVKPSKELQSLYLHIMHTQKTLETDLNIIQNDLKEAEYKTGPFFCEYVIFQETYRLIVRQAQREGRSVFLCLLTITDSHGIVPSLNTLEAAMKRLYDAIHVSLRRGDVVSKYSGAQYVILLPDITYEDGGMVMERIIKAYYHANRRSLLHLKYKLEQLSIPTR